MPCIDMHSLCINQESFFILNTKAKAIMKASIKLSNAFFLVLALCLCKPPITESILNKFKVSIINNLQNNTLDAHCQSKEDDLGLRHLAVHQEFSWKFRSNFWSTTLYFCNLRWVGGHKVFDAFTVDDKFLVANCASTYCSWKAQEDGIYAFSEKHKKYMFVHKWAH